MKTQNAISKNWSKIKMFFKNIFLKNNKRKVSNTPPVTKEILPPSIQGNKLLGLHLKNNRKTTAGRRMQRILIGKSQLGNLIYKYIRHSY